MAAVITDEERKQLVAELSQAMMIALARGRQFGLMAHPDGGYIVIDLGKAVAH